MELRRGNYDCKKRVAAADRFGTEDIQRRSRTSVPSLAGKKTGVIRVRIQIEEGKVREEANVMLETQHQN